MKKHHIHEDLIRAAWKMRNKRVRSAKSARKYSDASALKLVHIRDVYIYSRAYCETRRISAAFHNGHYYAHRQAVAVVGMLAGRAQTDSDRFRPEVIALGIVCGESVVLELLRAPVSDREPAPA
jgi:hypothetical protein